MYLVKNARDIAKILCFPISSGKLAYLCTVPSCLWIFVYRKKLQ